MAELHVTIPENSQNIGGVVTIRAPLEGAIDDSTTEIRTLSTFQSQAGRDGMVASGMEAGKRQSIEALGQLIEE
jgi:hypothetical protein